MDHEEYHAVENAFIEGYRQVADKLGFLRLAQIPLELTEAEGPSLKLIEVVFEEVFEVGRASPGFGSRELVYHPLPSKLVGSRTRLLFRYVSSSGVKDLSLADLLAPAGFGAEHDHHHHGGGHAHDHHACAHETAHRHGG